MDRFARAGWQTDNNPRGGGLGKDTDMLTGRNKDGRLLSREGEKLSFGGPWLPCIAMRVTAQLSW
jgi:hypothetical protein